MSAQERAALCRKGTRVARGQSKRYGVSGAALAQAAQCPVVPVAHNAGDLWARRGFRKTPGLIRFCVGPAIMPADKSPKEINLQVQNWIEAKMREISSAYSAT